MFKEKKKKKKAGLLINLNRFLIVIKISKFRNLFYYYE